MAEQQNKTHRKSKEKKQRDPASENPKANTFAHPGRFKRQAARSHDVKEKRLHVPLVDRLPEEAPPLVVGVVGPPQVGKTTLIKSLIRRYTKQTISNPTGPLTVVTSKRRRLTFIECPAESLAGMIDVAKVVDIVLLLIDGKFGFEMETMEFLNVLSASGMPGNVFGILTKLDLFKKQDTLRAQKKRLKHRFWSELYQGAKLFYLSGVVNGRYPDREVLNLSRFLSVMKNPRPLIWRNSHPYCLVDRFLDITPPTKIEENEKSDRTVALYGYLRGTNFPAQGARVHVPGAGDFNVAEIEALPDPCPTPHMDQAIAKATGKTKRTRLGEKQKVLFAPMSDVGGVLVDKDAVYIDVKTSTFDREAGDQENRGLGEQLVMGLQGDQRLLGYGGQDMQLFQNGTNERRPVQMADVDEIEDEAYGSAESEDIDPNSKSDDEEDEDGLLSDDSNNGVALVEHDATIDDEDDEDDEDNGNIVFADSDSDVGSISSADGNDLGDLDDLEDEELSGDEADGAVLWKKDLSSRAEALHGGKVFGRTKDLARVMYDLTLTPSQAIMKWKGIDKSNTNEKPESGNDNEEFFKQRSHGPIDDDLEDRMISIFDYNELEQKWTDNGNLDKIREKFVSGTSSRKDHDSDEDDFGEEDDELDEMDAEDEGDGAFEDLETGETHSAYAAKDQEALLETERAKNAKRKEELKQRFEEEDKEGFANDKALGRAAKATEVDAEYGEDEWYDSQKAKIQKQLDINRAEFEDMDPHSRVRVEGYKAGTYARVVLNNVPYEFSAHFNPRMPILLGGINPTEDRFGFVQVRIKRHRWHKRILKSNDPLVFSMGWRRFQTIPVYSISDSRTRNRMLKYTPEHMHCFASFYGPLIAPNTGFCCVQSFANKKESGFRVAATGNVLNVDESTEIVKKLKLKGVPHKVYKNTAIIRDMFGSDLEIMKFKSGNLRTVSGVRGMIKGRAGHQFPEGYIRAGFEDKILMSDIVFLSTWRSVKPREFYTPVTNLLMGPYQDENEQPWQGMRTTGEVRHEQGITVPQNKDSIYRPIERAERHFNPLRIPRKVQQELPFKSQPIQMKPQKNQTYMQKRAVVLGGEEKRARDLMQKLSTLRNEKVAKRQAAQERRKEPYRRKMAENLEKKAAREKREKDEYWRREGKKRKNDDGAHGGGASKKRR